MEKQNTEELKNQVESRLLKKIEDLEAVQRDLEEDTKNSAGSEREKNQQLLQATSTLLSELKQAHANIQRLVNPK